MPKRRPNILCFVTDQHRADHLGCYGNPQVRTPNIDRLASEGVVFTNSYVANPVCMPNRACMWTGKYPKAHGLRENGLTLSTSEVVMPEVLRRSGYQTASIGKIHLAPFNIKRKQADEECELYESYEYWADGGAILPPYYGLDHVCLVDGHGPYIFGDYKRWLDENHPGAYAKLKPENAVSTPTGTRQCWKSGIPEEQHYNTFIADRTIEFLIERDNKEPFFLWCSFPDPHHPYSPPEPYCDWYNPKDMDFKPARRANELDDLPDYFRDSYEGKIMTGGLKGNLRGMTDDQYRETIALTYGMISMVDVQIGRIMKTLEEQSLLDNTIIVFFSDHGDLMGDHWLTNKGPYLYEGLVRVPTIWRLPNGERSGQTTDELVSTVDLMPTLLELAGIDTPEGVQGMSYADALKGKGENSRDWVYIEYDESYINDRLRQLRSKDWAITAHATRRDGLLFDLKNDPDELHNLWDHPDYQNIKNELLAELFHQTSQADDWMPVKKVHA